MIFEHIDKLKQQYTDKYVIVDDSRPELQRFRGLTGAVKTVNFSGKALVEFDGYNNIGWYDIDPAFLRVVPAPPKTGRGGKGRSRADILPAAGEKPTAGPPPAAQAAAPAAAKPASAPPKAPIAPAPAAAPAKVAPGGKGMSMEEILASARG